MKGAKPERSVGIVGAGALGTLLASAFTQADVPVRILVRSPERGTAVKRVAPRAETTEDPAALFPASVLFFCVKSFQTADAANGITPALLEGLVPLVTLQNGWGHLDLLERALPGVPLIAGTTTLGAFWDDEGVFHASRAGSTLFAPWTRAAEPGAAVRLFTDANLRAERAADAREILWKKLVLNVAVNPVTGIHGVANGAVLEAPALFELSLAAAREAVAVGAARRFLPAPYEPEPLLRALLRDTAGNRSSMAEDLARGRTTEADAILGAVVREGAAAGVPTPIAASLAERLAVLESARSTHPRG